MVKIETTMGDMLIELDAEKAPVTVENFLSYVQDGFFDGTIFHRVIPGFMIQGGGFTEDMQQKETKAEIKNEADNGLTNEAYTLAMARTNEPHSASSQFFINVSDNGFLNHTSKTPDGWGYAVFGRVVEGTDVADQIVAVPRGRKGFHDDVPNIPVVMTKVSIVED